MDVIEITADNLCTVETGYLQSHACCLETRLLSDHQRERLAGRRLFRGAAARKLQRDREARELLPAVQAELDRRYHRPVDNIEQIPESQLSVLRAQWLPKILDRRQYVAAMMSTLGTFDGDRALAADQRARAIVSQIDRELRRRSSTPSCAAV